MNPQSPPEKADSQDAIVHTQSVWPTMIISAVAMALGMSGPIAIGDEGSIAPVVEQAAAQLAWLPTDARALAAGVDPRPGASYALPNAGDIDLDDPTAVFAHVFANLPEDVDVIPTENYLYWRFHTPNKYVWGNVRLGPGSRDSGQLHIGYYEFHEALTGPEDANPRHTVLDGQAGISINRIDAFTYDVAFEGKTVRFALNEVPQGLPTAFTLPEDDQFVMRTHDESGQRFHLLFNERTENFMFVADEDDGAIADAVPMGDDLSLDLSTGFLYLVDHDNFDRKVLLAVYRRNTAQNNYFDGPADQLSDNYISAVPEYREYLNRAYPFTRGVIDQFGFYVNDPENRIAVAPYYSYNTVAEVEGMLDVCAARGDAADILACMIPGGYHDAEHTLDFKLDARDALQPLDGQPGLPANTFPEPDSAAMRGAGIVNRVDLFVEDWEGADPLGAGGWVANGLWHLVSNPPTLCPPADSFSSPTTSAYYGVDGTCSYDVPGVTSGQLTSPVIPAIPPGAVLEFKQRRNTENACNFYDLSEVYISTNGIDFELLFETCDEANMWVDSGAIALDAYTGEDIALRFQFNTIDGVDNGFLGWMIDDVNVYVETIVPPTPGYPPPPPPLRPRHAAGTTWHIPGQSFIPPGSKHAAGITWHLPAQSFVPPGTIHNSGVTWHVGGASFIPKGSKHAAGITWHMFTLTFIPPGSKHNSGVTWHVNNQTFIPPGTKHAAGVTWHLANATFIPPKSKHNSGVTWHVNGQTFIPPGTKHAAGTTWHVPGASFIPPGSKHNSGSTWHVGGQSFIPPGTKHAAGTTWHIGAASFVPPGSKHNSGSTWHFNGQSFIPPGSKHNSGSTWHVNGQSFIPPGSKHNSGSTWHVNGQSFIPPGSKHAAGTTWHIAGASFIPPGSKHNSGSTWHVNGQSFIPPGSKHAAGITWHLGGISFIPPGTKHNSGVTWHVEGETFIPPGSKHAAGITWHLPNITFIPPGTKHNSGITWHVAGETFIPPNAKHMSGLTWHKSGATFLLANVNAAFQPCVDDGECPAEECFVGSCNAVDGTCELFPDPGQSCDDGDPNTQADTCDQNGACVGESIPGTPCDDGNDCTVGDVIQPTGACAGSLVLGMACDDPNHCAIPGTGACQPDGMCRGIIDIGATCDDGDATTLFDFCNEEGACSGQVDLECDDLLACNGEEIADPLEGCLPGEPPACGDVCSGEVGLCDDATGCVADGALICDNPDDDFESFCEAELQACVDTPVDCDDGNPCTDDFADSGGTCLHVALPDGETCDDGTACTTGDSCISGECVASGTVECGPCGDCDPDTGQCALVGSTDGDNDVDLDDHAHLLSCMDGPGGLTSDPSCGCFDRDADNDIDLIDFAEFQVSFTGSLDLP
ncbi:MAG: hypothetical protein DHS20C16_20390 [Phycisphaerae bacterium]|nr:MAG: hypothetical protein DHS20C16_20390 [Phycisphaerae bacterium]